MNINYSKLFDNVLSGFIYAMGVATAKWVSTLIAIRGFNLNF